MTIDAALKGLSGNETNIRFVRLVTIAKTFFGSPRIKGSHHIFKTPWPYIGGPGMAVDFSHRTTGLRVLTPPETGQFLILTHQADWEHEGSSLIGPVHRDSPLLFGGLIVVRETSEGILERFLQVGKGSFGICPEFLPLVRARVL